MNFGAGHAALASVREAKLAALGQCVGVYEAVIAAKLRRGPSLTLFARDDHPGRMVELAAVRQWAGRSFRADVVDARKLLMVFVNAAKLILLVDVRGGETFARRVRREIGAMQVSGILDEKRKRRNSTCEWVLYGSHAQCYHRSIQSAIYVFNDRLFERTAMALVKWSGTRG